MRQNAAAQNDHFVNVFVYINVVIGNDIWCPILQADAILYNEIQHTKYNYFKDFQCDFRLESGKMQE